VRYSSLKVEDWKWETIFYGHYSSDVSSDIVTSCYNIVSNFHVNTFYVYKLSYFGTRCEILGS